MTKDEWECEYLAIVDHAKVGCLQDAKQEREWFVHNCTNLNHAIKNACASLFPATFDGNSASTSSRLVMNSHQRRIGAAVLKEVASVLMYAASSIKRSKNFEDLHRTIGIIEQIQGVGPLTSYDISERIGWFLKIYPDYVYMHAGVTEGARAMCLTIQNGKIAKADFPRSFQTLDAMEIETLLCVYKACLADPSKFALGGKRQCC